MNQKIKKIVLLPLLFAASQSVHAIVVSSPSECPAGTTASFLGNVLQPPSFSPGVPSYDCITSNSDSAATTITSQTQRANSTTINHHIMDKVVREYVSEDKINKVGASADSNDYKPDGVWGETNFSSLTNHSNNVPGFSNNIYQFTGGLDKRQGDLFYGAALAYAYTDINQIGNSTMHTVGITPYAAYKINDYLFATGLASYYYSNTSASLGAANTDTHDYQGEANINTFKIINSFTLKGRAGVRYKHTESYQKSRSDASFDEITGIVDAQVDYKFDNGLTLFTGALYNHYTRDGSAVSSWVRGNDVVWMRYGAEYPVSKKFVVGAKIENDLNDKLTNYLTGSLNFRLEL